MEQQASALCCQPKPDRLLFSITDLACPYCWMLISLTDLAGAGQHRIEGRHPAATMRGCKDIKGIKAQLGRRLTADQLCRCAPALPGAGQRNCDTELPSRSSYAQIHGQLDYGCASMIGSRIHAVSRERVQSLQVGSRGKGRGQRQQSGGWALYLLSQHACSGQRGLASWRLIRVACHLRWPSQHSPSTESNPLHAHTAAAVGLPAAPRVGEACLCQGLITCNCDAGSGQLQLHQQLASTHKLAGQNWGTRG